MKTITFSSPKTAGNTTIAVNVALMYKQLSPNKSVAFIQIEDFPDLEFHLGLAPDFDYLNLEKFVKTTEWAADLLGRVAMPVGAVDFFHAPDMGADLLEGAFLKKVWDLFAKRYDVVFVDLGRSTKKPIRHFVFEQSEKILVTGLISPMHLRSVQSVGHKSEMESKMHFIINQCAKGASAKFNQSSLNVIGTLPSDEKGVWHQVYEGVPCAAQKGSVLRKNLLKIIPQL